MPTRFARRLDELLTQRFHSTGAMLTNRALADALAHAGYQVSLPYLSQLRRGHRNNPSPALTAALALLFGVDEDYFDHEPAPSVTPNRQLIDSVGQPALRRLVAALDGLSPDAIQLLGYLVTALRRAENRPLDRHAATL